MNIFVSSPQAQVGKTFISAGLAAIMQAFGYKCAYHKPIQMGAENNFGFWYSPDVAFVKNTDPYIDCVCSYSFKTFAAPAISAELENIKIDINVILKDYKNIVHNNDCTIVEGLDGLLLPISNDFKMADLIKLLDLPVLFVVDPQTSNIEAVLSSLNQASTVGLKTIGVILNKFIFYSNTASIKAMPRLIEEYTDAKILGVVKQFAPDITITPTTLIDTLLNSLDIEKIFGVPMPNLNPGM